MITGMNRSVKTNFHYKWIRYNRFYTVKSDIYQDDTHAKLPNQIAYAQSMHLRSCNENYFKMHSKAPFSHSLTAIRINNIDNPETRRRWSVNSWMYSFNRDHVGQVLCWSPFDKLETYGWKIKNTTGWWPGQLYYLAGSVLFRREMSGASYHENIFPFIWPTWEEWQNDLRYQ